MHLINVDNKKSRKEFLEVPKILYRDDENWACPFDSEIEALFDPVRNKCFEDGDAKRWILKDTNGSLIGRIAAFYDHRKTDKHKQLTGSIGFFECIDNQEAANILFDVARDWLKERKMEAMLGPANFGENFVNWGLLIDGFMPQGFGMPYNFPYYRKLYENYGFKIYFEQYSYHKKVADGYPERLYKFARYVSDQPKFTFEHFSFKKKDKYIKDLTDTFNGIWSAFHDNYTPIHESEMREMFDQAKMLVYEKFIWFAYDNGKPAGLLLVFPDFNQLYRKLKNGKRNLINLFKIMYYKNRLTRARVFVGGVLPEYQRTWLIAALFTNFFETIKSIPRYTEFEMGWVGDYNPKMQRTWEVSGASKAKTHATYMYLFDRKAKFEKFTNEFEGKEYKWNEKRQK